ncbi:unnamed protein product [Dicrocoelium dendriticum]|nr:unnamed protein product [Dicrocoelium dendriticum]
MFSRWLLRCLNYSTNISSLCADVSIVNERGHRPIMYAKDRAIKDLLAKTETELEAKKTEMEREERRLQPLESRLRKALVGQEAAIRTARCCTILASIQVQRGSR